MRFLVILIALLQPVALTAQSAKLAIDAGNGVQTVQVDRDRGDAVFSLSSLKPFGATLETDARSARLSIFSETIVFEPGSPFFRAGSDIYQLSAAARRRDRAILVPVSFLTEWLPAHYPTRVAYQNNTLSTRTRTRTQPAPVPTPAPSTESAPTTRTAPPDPRPPAPATSTATAPAKEDRVVIIDAGHGGRDSGKVGPNGLAEKTVTLTVAKKLAALLRDRGYEVHLTRTRDTLIALADRPRFANQWKNGRPAALFVSIHANAGVSKARGFETYFLSEARTEDERRVAEMENAAVSFEERPATSGPAIEQLLTGLKNDYYQHASNDFAEVIQRELGAFHPGPSRGVKQAGFRVLVGAVMPAVLVEVAFISNPGEARLLGSAAFQDKIAYSLSRSIGNFFDSHQHLWQAAEVQ